MNLETTQRMKCKNLLVSIIEHLSIQCNYLGMCRASTLLCQKFIWLYLHLTHSLTCSCYFLAAYLPRTVKPLKYDYVINTEDGRRPRDYVVCHCLVGLSFENEMQERLRKTTLICKNAQPATSIIQLHFTTKLGLAGAGRETHIAAYLHITRFLIKLWWHRKPNPCPPTGYNKMMANDVYA